MENRKIREPLGIENDNVEYDKEGDNLKVVLF